jgi:hypothetical protein
MLLVFGESLVWLVRLQELTKVVVRGAHLTLLLAWMIEHQYIRE